MKRLRKWLKSVENLQVYYGDLHNHCNVGYGHGSAEDAFHNARLQLDFVCITPHAYWHDIPRDEERLAPVVAYHENGFERAAARWPHFKELVRRHHRDGEFVTFLGFEWHSRHYGDHNIYFKGDEGEIIRADDMNTLRAALREVKARGVDVMLVPHHIGYKAGYRGINWAEFNSEFIRLVEIMSMHGASERPTMPNRYLHTMGPLDWESSLQYGLAQGHMVGVVGSTDHHSAHPGSYGHGRVAVWAEDLTRESIWQALRARRTYALTGDRIRLEVMLNGVPMGAVAPAGDERKIEISVQGGDTLDYVEIVHNNQTIHRWNPSLSVDTSLPAEIKLYLEMGWGERGENVDWQGALRVVDGDLIDIEPRFRGHEVVEPQARNEDRYAFTQWERDGLSGVRFTTCTWGNPTTTTANTQGMCFCLHAGPQTRLEGVINGQPVNVRVADLLSGPRAYYLGGFLTPVYYFHRPVTSRDYTANINFTHRTDSPSRDWYYVRVRQKNGQWAWSSPIWVEPVLTR